MLLNKENILTKVLALFLVVATVAGESLIYEFVNYPESKKKLVGFQITFGTIGLYVEAPFRESIYVKLQKTSSLGKLITKYNAINYLMKVRLQRKNEKEKIKKEKTVTIITFGNYIFCGNDCIIVLQYSVKKS